MDHGSTFVDYLAAASEIAAAADYFGPGALETPHYEQEILDLVRRRGALGQRCSRVPGTGQPSRYFEQSRIASGTFRDPRNLQFAGSNDPTRRERAITIKALQSGINFGLFDVEVTRQQGQFSQLVAKDIMDTVTGVLRTSDQAMWNGSDTDLANATTLEYVGLLTQINRTASIASTASIVDGLKAEVASMMANTSFAVRPSAIYGNPIALDLIDQEERLYHRQMGKVEVVAGLRVNALATQAGELPLIPDWALPSVASATESGKTDYRMVIVMEELIEAQYITTPDPRVFPLGLEGNLATRYSIVLFDAVVAKGKANANQDQSTTESSLTSYAHSVVTVTR